MGQCIKGWKCEKVVIKIITVFRAGRFKKAGLIIKR
jgi:hypothetical protein